MSKFVSIKDRIYNATNIIKIEFDAEDGQIGITYDTRDGTEIDLIQFTTHEDNPDDGDITAAYEKICMDLLN